MGNDAGIPQSTVLTTVTIGAGAPPVVTGARLLGSHSSLRINFDAPVRLTTFACDELFAESVFTSAPVCFVRFVVDGGDGGGDDTDDDGGAPVAGRDPRRAIEVNLGSTGVTNVDMVTFANNVVESLSGSPLVGHGGVSVDAATTLIPPVAFVTVGELQACNDPVVVDASLSFGSPQLTFAWNSSDAAVRLAIGSSTSPTVSFDRSIIASGTVASVTVNVTALNGEVVEETRMISSAAPTAVEVALSPLPSTVELGAVLVGRARVNNENCADINNLDVTDVVLQWTLRDVTPNDTTLLTDRDDYSTGYIDHSCWRVRTHC